MKREVKLFTKPEELIDWLNENDLLMGLSTEDATVLLNYMEGHDYGIGIDTSGRFIRQDISEKEGEIEDYTIDDVIDMVTEWNYELVLDATEVRENPNDFIDFVAKQERYESLKTEEKKLDIMFNKTKYGKDIEELAIKIANEAMQRIETSKRQEFSAVSDEAKQYKTDKWEKVR